MIGELTSSDEVHKAKAAAAKALKLDPDMGAAHVATACSLFLELQLKSAEDHFRHALSLGATAAIRQLYADLLMADGRFEEASTQLQESRRLDSFSCRQKISDAQLYYLTLDTIKHQGFSQDEIAYSPVPHEALLFQADLLVRTDRVEAAVSLIEAIPLSSDEGLPTLSAVAGILALAGQPDRAWAIIDRSNLLNLKSSISKTHQSRLSVALQDEEGCTSFLRVAIPQKEPQLAWIATDPRFGNLRDTVIYTRAVEAVG